MFKNESRLLREKRINEIFNEFKRQYLELDSLINEYENDTMDKNYLKKEMLCKIKEIEMPLRMINNNIEMTKKDLLYNNKLTLKR